MEPRNLRVTIITATRNAGNNLEQSMASVLSQTYPHIEYIVVDGGSTDRTLSILRSVDQKIKFRWVSEKDQGIADAFNKGVGMAHGDFLYFLGADDVLKTPYVIEQVMKGVDPKNDMLVCGKVDRIRKSKDYSVIYTSSLLFSPWMLLYKMGLPHQGLFMNKRFFKKYGLFDTHVKYAMDYELLLRAYHEFPRVVLKDIVVAGWREGGVGKNKLYKILDEYHRIRIKNHIAPLWILRIIHETVKARYRLITI